MRLVLQFLGLPQVFLDDKPIATDRRKAIALLAYLAVNDIGHPPQRYSREALSALFWPDYEQAKAFSNLRTILWEIRQTLGEGWLLADRESVQSNPDAQIDSDVARFQNLLSQGRQQSDPAFRIPLLSEAVKLYRDHFLAGFSLKDAPNFNEWAFAESEDLRRKLADALTLLSEAHCALGQADQAIPYMRRLVALDPLNEAAHRQLMEVYLQAGQHSAALKQYQTCEQILRKEMNLDPQPETRALYKKILKGEVKPAHIEKEIEAIGPKHNLPTGTVTFLFTDIEGNTKLAQQYPDAMPALLARQNEILNQSIKNHNGYVFQVVGDEFSAAFHSAREALDAALDAQHLLQNEVWSPATLKVRMGIHTGVAQLNEASVPTVYSGYTTLALAQRIMSAGHGGQVLLSNATETLVHGQLPEHVNLRDMGEHKFKDILQPLRVFQVITPDLQKDFPALRALDVLPNNLPIQLTSFVGRNKEIEQIKEHLKQSRLVTLTGSGGIGKTRLALQVASELLPDFSEGVWLVVLAPLSDPTLMPQAIANSLGLIEQADRPPLTVLSDFLHDRHILLLLDNCEHLIQACAQLAEALLHACPNLHILATSREALEISGETLYRVPSLVAPDLLNITFDILPQYEAVQLFVERAQSVLRDFSLTQDNAHAIAQVCYHLDGIPLALELAAARVKVLRAEEIAVRLDDRFHLLTGGARTALPRHQTLRAMIDWSHNLLPEPERVLLRRLSVFAGGWTLEAAESACEADGIEKREILDLLTQLINKSLILAERKQGQETRYRMLETIRQYAQEKLWAAGEGELMRQRHLAYFVDLAERAEPNLRAFDMVLWLDRLETELDNIRVALGWAQESDVEAQLRIASALLWFWHIRGHGNEGIDWLEHGLSIEKAERGDKPLTPSRTIIRGKALNAIGELRGDALVGKIAEHFEESLALFKELGPAGKQGMAYALLGLAGRIENRETKKHEQVLSLFREIGDKFGVAQSLTGVAYLARLSGDFERARAAGEEQLALRQEIGDKDGIANVQALLGLTILRQGDYQHAKELFEASLAGFREVGNIYYVGLALSLLSVIAEEQNNYVGAAIYLQEALTLAQNVGNLFITARVLNNLGKLAWAQGKYQLAEKRFNEGINVCRISHDQYEMAFAFLGLGRVAQSRNDYATARSFYSKGIVIGQEIDNEFIQTVCLSEYVILAIAQRKPHKAARLGGAIEKRIPSMRLEMSPVERAEHDQAIAAARAALAEEAFAAAWEEGKKMTLDEAIAYALGDNA